MGASFVAIDFETADYQRDSACAVGLVRVEEDRISARLRLLIRPPRRDIVFTYIHGLAWSDLANQPLFKDAWPRAAEFIDGAAFLAAHNASFDRGVMLACCKAAGISPPALRFECTVKLARRTWNLRKASLPVVCKRLGIPLDHHEPLSDAEACARIVIAARKVPAKPKAKTKAVRVSQPSP